MAITLENPQHAEAPHPAEKKSFAERFQDKLAESRFFAISLILHLGIVVLAGTIAIYKAIEAPDFVAEGAEGLVAATDDLSPPPETPQDAVPQQEFAPQAPTLDSPTIDVISTSAPTNTYKVAPTQVRVNISTNVADIAKATNQIAKGAAAGLGKLPSAMAGRVGAGRANAMRDKGMKTPTELAVLKGLEWLRLNQSADGSWGEKNKGAMTGFALLCFLGHGETPTSAQYGVTVNKAVQWFLDNGTKFQGRLSMENNISQHGCYEHGIATYALGEYYTMTKDERVVELFKQAMNYIVEGQGPTGGWAYAYNKTNNDLSVSGWQIQALKAAHLSELKLPGVDAALERAMTYLENTQGPKGGYGYSGPQDSYSLTGVGILCRLFWQGDKAKLKKGMEWLLTETETKPVKYKGEHANLYAWYYHTQACLMFGGSAWTKWNKWFQDDIVAAQSPDGSWPIPGAKGTGPQGEDSKTGAVYRTTLCILMLEVFYRYMPTNRGS